VAILTAYLDESGTHDGSPLTMMAGYVGYSGAWRKFDRKWSNALRKEGISHFHAKDFVKGSGEFRRWTEQRKLRFIDKADILCKAHCIFGFASSFSNSDYESIWLGRGPLKKGQLDSKYGLAFRLVMCFLPDIIHRIFAAVGKQVTLHLALESGHKNAGDVIRIYEQFLKDAPPHWVQIMGTLTFVEKLKCKQVQGADSLAWSAYRVEQRPPEELPIQSFDFNREDWKPALEYAKKDRGDRPVFRLRGTENVLAELRDNLFAQVEARQAYGRQRSRPESDGHKEAQNKQLR